MNTTWDDIYQKYQKGGEAWATLAEDIHPLFLPFIERSNFPRKHVLDIGCGDGKYLKLLHDLGFTVTGLDSSETAAKMTVELVPDAEIIISDMYGYVIPSDTYDLVLSVSTIHHGTKDQIHSAIQKIHAALTDDGSIFITVPELTPEREKKLVLDHAVLGNGTFAPLSGPEKGLAHSFYTEAELRKVFQEFKHLHLELDEYHRWVITGTK